MLSELCLELKNWFDRGQPKIIGNIEIAGQKIVEPAFTKYVQDGQYFRVVGSVFNDGVYCFSEELEFHDEKFHGAIWLMAIPADVIKLADDIDAWCEKYAGIDSAAMSPFQSESFGGYSYSKGSVSTSSSGGVSNPNSWQAVFASRMNRWRKI